MIQGGMADAPVLRRFRAQRLDLACWDWGGAGERPPLILIHGGNDHARSWDRLAEALSATHHVIAADLRGHGESAWSPDGYYALLPHIHDLAALYRAFGLARAAIVAHSFGGSVAHRYAGVYPDTVTKLVLIEGLGRPPEWRAQWRATPIDERIADYFERLDRENERTPQAYATVRDAALRLQARNPSLPDALADHLALHGTRDTPAGLVWKFDPRVRPPSPLDLSAEEAQRLRQRIACPVLMLDGSESYGAAPAMESAADFADARRIVLDPAGHWVHHDQPDATLAAIREFLT